jgi:hypothetical protein
MARKNKRITARVVGTPHDWRLGVGDAAAFPVGRERDKICVAIYKFYHSKIDPQSQGLAPHFIVPPPKMRMSLDYVFVNRDENDALKSGQSLACNLIG